MILNNNGVLSRIKYGIKKKRHHSHRPSFSNTRVSVTFTLVSWSMRIPVIIWSGICADRSCTTSNIAVHNTFTGAYSRHVIGIFFYGRVYSSRFSFFIVSCSRYQEYVDQMYAFYQFKSNRPYTSFSPIRCAMRLHTTVRSTSRF